MKSHITEEESSIDSIKPSPIFDSSMDHEDQKHVVLTLQNQSPISEDQDFRSDNFIPDKNLDLLRPSKKKESQASILS